VVIENYDKLREQYFAKKTLKLQSFFLNEEVPQLRRLYQSE
jgi:hypothetical protein